MDTSRDNGSLFQEEYFKDDNELKIKAFQAKRA